MKTTSEHKSKRRSAMMVSALILIFMSIISVVILLTEDNLELLDYMLIIGGPCVLSVLFYFVVLHHDPDASD